MANPYADLVDEKKRNPYDDLAPAPTGADIAKSAAYALPKAGAAMAGMVGDVRDLARAGRTKLRSYLPESLANLDERIPSPYQLLTSLAPNSGDIRRAAETVTGPWYDPQSRAAKVVDTGVQTAATMGSGWLRLPKLAATTTAGITAGTEVAGAATDDNPWARILGGLFGGAPSVMRNAIRSREGQVVRDAIGAPSAAEIDAAKGVEARARDVGVPLLGTESLDRGGQLASYLYASPTGNKVIDPFMRARPGQVKGAVDTGLLSGTGPRDTPAGNATRAQKAATDVIQQAEQARTAAVNPYYAAAEFETVPTQSLRPVSNEIQSLIYHNPINAPADAQLSKWYSQAFPLPMEAPPAPVGRVQGKARAAPSVDVNKDDMITAIRKLGGINPKTDVTTALSQGNPFSAHPQWGPVWRSPIMGTSVSNKSVAGHSIDDMAQKLYDHGYIPEPDLNHVMDGIADASMGKQAFSRYRDAPANDPLAMALDRLTTQLEAKRAPNDAPAPAAPEGMLPETNVGRLSRLYRDLGTERQLPEVGATAEQKITAYPAGKVQDVLGDVLRRENPNFRTANDTYAQITRDVVEPLRAGPVGTVAGVTGFDPAAQSNVPRVLSAVADSSVARPETIRLLYSQLNKADRQAFPGLAQTYIENELSKALADLRSGGNPTAGQKFRQAIAGDPQKQANFDEMMRGVALANGKNPALVVRGANQLLEVLDRTGRTPGIGSQTQPRGEIQKELGKTKTSDVLASVSASPLRTAAKRFDDWILRHRNERLAQALTAPNSVDLLVKLANVKTNGVSASYYAAALLGLDDATVDR